MNVRVDPDGREKRLAAPGEWPRCGSCRECALDDDGWYCVEAWNAADPRPGTSPACDPKDYAGDCDHYRAKSLALQPSEGWRRAWHWYAASMFLVVLSMVTVESPSPAAPLVAVALGLGCALVGRQRGRGR